MYIKIPCDQVSFELKKMGVHPTGIALMAPKAVVEPLRLVGVRAPGANIIKQEMLAMGADAANAKGTINCSIERTDVILLGSRTQYRHLAHKLRANQGWFGLDEVIRDIEDYLTDHELATILADGRTLTYEKMRIMGILNVTPDSFYSGSRVTAGSLILKRAGKMLDDGADVLDIGGESTRPGSDPVPAEEEIRRVVGAISEIRRAYPEAILSVDTYHAATARAALDAGADIINDVTAGTGDPDMLSVAKEKDAPLILMHMRGTPKTMMSADMKAYHNVVGDVMEYLLTRTEACEAMGIGRTKLMLDPGLGFAKDVSGNLELSRGLAELTGHGIPVLVAGSRKSYIGKVLGDLPPEERLEGTMALSAAAVFAGTQMVRVHDVKENVRLIRMLEAILSCR